VSPHLQNRTLQLEQKKKKKIHLTTEGDDVTPMAKNNTPMPEHNVRNH
jgi:hypothetical protein